MEAYYQASQEGTDATKRTYDIWRTKSPTNRPNIDPNKLANQRRYIMNKKKLAEIELADIQQRVRQNHDTGLVQNEETEQDDDQRQEDQPIRPTEDQNIHQRAKQNEQADNVQDDTESDEGESMNEENYRITPMKKDILRTCETAEETPISERLPIPNI